MHITHHRPPVPRPFAASRLRVTGSTAGQSHSCSWSDGLPSARPHALHFSLRWNTSYTPTRSFLRRISLPLAAAWSVGDIRVVAAPLHSPTSNGPRGVGAATLAPMMQRFENTERYSHQKVRILVHDQQSFNHSPAIHAPPPNAEALMFAKYPALVESARAYLSLWSAFILRSSTRRFLLIVSCRQEFICLAG
jgi:hypothetical protein